MRTLGAIRRPAFFMKLKIDEANKAGNFSAILATLWSAANYLSGIEWNFGSIDWERAGVWFAVLYGLVWHQSTTNRNRPAPGGKQVSYRPTTSSNDFKLSAKSLAKLNGVNEDLVRVVKRALKLSEYDFVVTSGVRTIEQQKVLFDDGKSKTMRSRHLTGDAVDVAVLVNNKASWEPELYRPISEAFKQAGDDLGVPIEWGGDWKGFYDGTHFQLPRVDVYL